MAINPISSNIIDLIAPSAALTPENTRTGAENGSFSDIFSQALGNVAATDDQDKQSTLELLSGMSDNMAGMLIDSQKAEVALSLSLAIRNKVLDAYTEIMRMQV